MRQGDVLTLGPEGGVTLIELVVGERKPDMAKPFEVLFRWTGTGFMVGASMLGWSGAFNPWLARCAAAS